MPVSRRIVYLSGPEDDGFGEPQMKFRLTYYGPLRPTNRDALEHHDDPLSEHKQAIRREFHGQLKQLWVTNRFLREHKVPPGFSGPVFRSVAETGAMWGADTSEWPLMRDAMAECFQLNGFKFLPLAPESFGLLCSLNILFLRRDIPGSAITAGDIDNRVKTIIDALRYPQKPNEFVGAKKQPIVPLDGEMPFYVLLEDDKQVSHFSVETDTLLDPPADDNETDQRMAKVIITVELRPLDITLFNLSYA